MNYERDRAMRDQDATEAMIRMRDPSSGSRKSAPVSPDQIEPKHIDGIAALLTAERTAMGKRKGEYDTEFVKRIVATYLNAHAELHLEVKS
jgi:hypothetical protein